MRVNVNVSYTLFKNVLLTVEQAGTFRVRITDESSFTEHLLTVQSLRSN